MGPICVILVGDTSSLGRSYLYEGDNRSVPLEPLEKGKGAFCAAEMEFGATSTPSVCFLFKIFLLLLFTGVAARMSATGKRSLWWPVSTARGSGLESS